MAFATDGLAIRKLATVAAALNLELEVQPTPAVPTGHDIAAIVVELELEGAVGAVARLKEANPQTFVAGFVTYPGGDLWREAEDAGCDLVATRGTLAKQLPDKIDEWRREPGGRRIRLFDIRDIAGRLGVVARLADTPVGPVAVYHLGNDLVAVQDACPHAGALLSEGQVDVDAGVVTCPQHGSRFDARSGERLRGPADTPLASYRIVIEDSHAYLRTD